MKGNSQIEHKGKIKALIGDQLQVGIAADSACGSCQLKGNCMLSEAEEKIVDIKVIHPEIYQEGEEVVVFFRQSLGFRALFLAYLFPFFIIVITMIILISATEDELTSGLVSVGVLIPYYLILYLFRNKIKKTFSFHIRKVMFLN